MAKNKLQKFAELRKLTNTIQPDKSDLLNDRFCLKGFWKKEFKNNNPIILELGCGKGEYTINLAKKFPANNYVGIDIKGYMCWGLAKCEQG